MIQRPTFDDSELYCIEEAVKEDLKRFYDIHGTFFKTETANEIRDEFKSILNKIDEWKKEECDLTKALKQLKPIKIL